MNKKGVVRLEDEERTRLETLVSQGRASARTIQLAWFLLKADVRSAGPGRSDIEIQRTFAVGLVPASSPFSPWSWPARSGSMSTWVRL